MISVYVMNMNHFSGKIQYLLYEDMRTGTFRESSTAKFNVLNLEYPNLSLSALPMKALVGRYYFLGEQYDKALELLDQAKNDNPFIMYSESIKADVFYRLGLRDSSLIYTKKAFNGIPNNERHFMELAKNYNGFNKYDSVDSIFKLVEKKYNSNIWKFYFTSVLVRDSIPDYAKRKAQESLEIWKNSKDPELKLSAIYVLYGIDNIQEAIKKVSIADSLFNEGSYDKAALLYGEASELNPSDYVYKENAGISNFKYGYFDRAIPYFKYVIDSLNPKTGKSEFLLAQIYEKQKDYSNACKYIRLSSQANYSDAYRFIPIYCK